MTVKLIIDSKSTFWWVIIGSKDHIPGICKDYSYSKNNLLFFKIFFTKSNTTTTT